MKLQEQTSCCTLKNNAFTYICDVFVCFYFCVSSSSSSESETECESDEEVEFKPARPRRKKSKNKTSNNATFLLIFCVVCKKFVDSKNVFCIFCKKVFRRLSFWNLSCLAHRNEKTKTAVHKNPNNQDTDI